MDPKLFDFIMVADVLPMIPSQRFQSAKLLECLSIHINHQNCTNSKSSAFRSRSRQRPSSAFPHTLLLQPRQPTLSFLPPHLTYISVKISSRSCHHPPRSAVLVLMLCVVCIAGTHMSHTNLHFHVHVCECNHRHIEYDCDSQDTARLTTQLWQCSES